MTNPSDPDSPPPRTTGGNWRWEPPSPEELETILPGYSVEKLLGRGGMGAVYKGVQKSLDRPVAIKILPGIIEKEDTSFAERFSNEAKVMARLLHPAIVAVFDFGEARDGQFFFVMEYVDGTDIAEMISSQGKLPAEHAHAITAHVCDALTAAHALGIVHRDIKPANVLINRQGQVKVADFGLAKIDEPDQRGLTQTGMALGTPDYVAPEALVMGVNVDARADLYAVGVMLYQMLTGEVPRGAFKVPSEKVPGLDHRFDAIVMKAVQSDPADRYQSSTDLRRDLDVILTVPLVKADAPQTAALPQQVVDQVPGQRTAAPKMVVRGNRKFRTENTAPVSPPEPPSYPSSSGKKSAFLWGGIGAAALVVVGGFFAINAKGPKEGEAPPLAAVATDPSSKSVPEPDPPKSEPEPTKQSEPKPEPPEETPKASAPVTPEPKPPAEAPAKPTIEQPKPKEAAPAPVEMAAATPENSKSQPTKTPPPTSAPTPKPPTSNPDPPATAPASAPTSSLGDGRPPALPAGLSADVSERLAQIDGQFQTAYDRDIAPGHTAAVLNLDGNYAAAVRRALDAAVQAGNLEESIALRAEQDRISKKGRLPVADLDSVHQAVRNLRDTYRTALAKFEADRFAKAKPYHERHDQLLDAYQKELTQQKRLPDALAVKARRDRLAAALVAIQAKTIEADAVIATAEKESMEPGKAQTPQLTPTPPEKPVKIPEGTTVESVIAWVLEAGGTIEVYKDGAKITSIDTPAKIPPPPFQVYRVALGRLNRDVTDEDFATLAVMTSLEDLYIESDRVKIDSLASITGLTKLKSIRIGHAEESIPEKELRHLVGLTELQRMTIVVEPRTGESCDSLAGLTKLREFSLLGAGRLTLKGAEAIATLQQLTMLRLDNLDRISQSRFAPIATLPNLESMEIHQTEPTAEFFSHVAKFPKLNRIDITGLVEVPAKSISALKPAADRLVTIYTGYGAKFTDEGVQELVATLPNLEAYARSWSTDDCTVKSLEALAKLTRLKKLALTPNKDADLAISDGFPVLESLSIQSKTITDGVFEHLKQFPKLKRVQINKGNQVTQAGIDQFKKDRPNVIVVIN